MGQVTHLAVQALNAAAAGRISPLTARAERDFDASLAIWNRTRSKSEDLRQRLLRLYPELPIEIASNDPAGAELVVNATSLGLRDGDQPPLDLEKLQARQAVAEIVMKPVMTPLLLAAEARGCRICPGAPMLDCQLALMAGFMGISRQSL